MNTHLQVQKLVGPQGKNRPPLREERAHPLVMIQQSICCRKVPGMYRGGGVSKFLLLILSFSDFEHNFISLLKASDKSYTF